MAGPLSPLDDWVKEKASEAYDAIVKPVTVPKIQSTTPWWVWAVGLYLLSRSKR